MRTRGIRGGVLAVTAAATMLAPATATAAPAATAPAENCFIHTDDWVACVCGPVARLLANLTGDPWTCQ